MSVKQIINDIKLIRAPYIYTEFYNSQECPQTITLYDPYSNLGRSSPFYRPEIWLRESTQLVTDYALTM